METIIGEVKGYTMFYDNRNHLFTLRDSEGEEVGSGKTQEEVEEQADKLSKEGYKFPIEALQHSMLYLYAGRVTSINPSDKSVRFVRAKVEGDRFYGGGHTKEKLRYSHLYEATEANQKIAGEVANRRAQISQLEGEIENLLCQLEKPINLEYFGLKDSY